METLMRVRRFPLWIFITCAASISSCSAFAAGAFNPKVADVCIKSPENPTRLVLNPNKLAAQLVEKTLGITPIDLNTNGTGITGAQEVEAVLDPPVFCSTSACGPKISDKLLPAYQ